MRIIEFPKSSSQNAALHSGMQWTDKRICCDNICEDTTLFNYNGTFFIESATHRIDCMLLALSWTLHLSYWRFFKNCYNQKYDECYDSPSTKQYKKNLSWWNLIIELSWWNGIVRYIKVVRLWKFATPEKKVCGLFQRRQLEGKTN